MYELIDFYYLGQKLRVVVVDDKTFYFAAVDVCKMLDITSSNVSRILCKVVPEDERIKLFELLRKTNDSILTLTKGTRNPGKWAAIKPCTQLVTEAGLYRLIMRSNKPEAKRYQKWVFEDVLPLLHRTGTYTIPGFDKPQISEPAQQESKSHKVAHVKGCFSYKNYCEIGNSKIEINITLDDSFTTEKALSIKQTAANNFDLLVEQLMRTLTRKM
ncbi:MAG: hypothetical protein IJT21_05745 [Synergistaceae bacterium]|nr:hypothetical protein [Synergistaceae bacterium]